VNRLVIPLAMSFAMAGCVEVSVGSPVRGPLADRENSSLPFRPMFLERSNERNDGSVFEPCNAYADGELATIGIAPRSVRDAAFSRGPNFRGCEWRMPASLVTQIVANQGSLREYKRDHHEVVWQADTVAGGHTIATGSYRSGECTSVFKSQAAVVITYVAVWQDGKWPGTACEWVVKFASLAASKAP
jgi:hypothetical protein